MLLQEEYLTRHKLIKEVPILPHVKEGSLLFFSVTHSLMKIKWEAPSYCPGKYIIRFYRPLHDGYVNRNFFSKYAEEKVQYENYQSFISEFSRWKVQVVENEKEVELIAWQIFLFCFDNWLAKHAGLELSKLIYKTVSKDLSLETRYLNHKLALINLEINHSLIYAAYEDSILHVINPYSYWLAKLFYHQKEIEKKSETL